MSFKLTFAFVAFVEIRFTRPNALYACVQPEYEYLVFINILLNNIIIGMVLALVTGKYIGSMNKNVWLGWFWWGEVEY